MLQFFKASVKKPPPFNRLFATIAMKEADNAVLQAANTALQEECARIKAASADTEAELQARNAEFEQRNAQMQADNAALQEKLDKTIRVGDDLESATFWKEHYRNGGTSGSGSYGRLADFKAFTVNTLTDDYQISRIVEIGCGDGNQLKKLNVESYTGVDISAVVIERHRALYAKNAGKAFYTTDERELYIRQRFECVAFYGCAFPFIRAAGV